MSNHSVSYALNSMVLKIIEGYNDNEISENYVRKLFSKALSTSYEHDGNDHEVLEGVSNSFCGKCLKMKKGDFFKIGDYCCSNGVSLVRVANSFLDSEPFKDLKDIAEKFNFSKEDIKLLEREFNESCTNALCTDCLKEEFDKITGSRDKTNEVMEYFYEE